MRRGLLGVLGLLPLSWSLAGCGEPDRLVPVMPPGATEIRKVDEKNAAQAQGETRTAPSTPAPKAGETYPPAPPTAPGETKTLTGDVKYETLREGNGEEMKSGRVASVYYVGKLDDGTVFDSKQLPDEPAEFALGTGGLIKGWEHAIPGMKVGEKRKIVIPPAMGYGDQSQAKIPANSTLTFEVELVGVK